MKDLDVYLLTFNCGRALIQVDAFARHLFDGWEAPASDRLSAAHPVTSAAKRGQNSVAGASLPDLVVLNLQELAPISYAFLGGTWTDPYFHAFQKAVEKATAIFLPGNQNSTDNVGASDSQYVNVVARNVGLTAIMVFIRFDLVDKIADLTLAEVGVGVSDMGNKGAVGVRLGLTTALDPSEESDSQPEGRKQSGNMYMTFVSAHLTPHEPGVEARNENYYQIVKGLVFDERSQQQMADERASLLRGHDEDETGVSSPRGPLGMYSEDSHVFFAGDLNYRTASDRPGPEDTKLFPQPTKDSSDPRHFSQFLARDQLAKEVKAGKTLQGMSEMPITFPPTYKYHHSSKEPVLLDDEVERWDWAEHRWPSWCDRILYSTTKEHGVRTGKYSSLPIFLTSDHRPVALSVAVPFIPVTGNTAVSRAPGSVNPNWRSGRDWARRKELVVGGLSYAALTWEGNGLLAGTVLIVVGAWWLSRAAMI